MDPDSQYGSGSTKSLNQIQSGSGSGYTTLPETKRSMKKGFSSLFLSRIQEEKCSDPGYGMKKCLNSDPGKNIPDPQHCIKVSTTEQYRYRYNFEHTLKINITNRHRMHQISGRIIRPLLKSCIRPDTVSDLPDIRPDTGH
jgi:hypothetical protein